jgi:hypothetical protein
MELYNEIEILKIKFMELCKKYNLTYEEGLQELRKRLYQRNKMKGLKNA